jgi:hypothetical protein
LGDTETRKELEMTTFARARAIVWKHAATDRRPLGGEMYDPDLVTPADIYSGCVPADVRAEILSLMKRGRHNGEIIRGGTAYEWQG